ncbi:hypothetical protein Tco_0473217, partial [Tanacetum coccineum]
LDYHGAIIVVQFRAVSFKVALSSALKATIALMIIVVVTVVVVVVSRQYPTFPGQMANPIAVTVPRRTRTCFVMAITLGT